MRMKYRSQKGETHVLIGLGTVKLTQRIRQFSPKSDLNQAHLVRRQQDLPVTGGLQLTSHQFSGVLVTHVGDAFQLWRKPTKIITEYKNLKLPRSAPPTHVNFKIFQR